MKRVLIVSLVVLATSWGVGARAQQSAADSEKVVLRLVQEMMTAPNGLPDWIANNREKLTLDVAARADELADHALANVELNAAQQRWLFASLVYRELKRPRESLMSFLHSQNAAFLAGRSAEQFEMVHENALEIEKTASGINQTDMLFEAQVLEADCSLYANGNENDTALAQKQILDELSETAKALTNEKYAPDRYWRERLVKQLNELSSRTMHRLIPQAESQEKANALFKQIAAGMERAVPLDFESTLNQYAFLGPVDRRQTIRTAQALADLSYAYGSKAAADARLSVAESRARAWHAVDLWALIVASRYERARSAGAPAEQLRQLRNQARGADAELRAMFHSRAGRIWSGYQADLVFGEMLEHQLGEDPPDAAQTFSAVEALKARTLLDAMAARPITGPFTEQVSGLEQRVVGFAKDTDSHAELAAQLLRQFLPGMAQLEAKGDVTMNELKLTSQLSSFDNRLGSAEPREQALRELEVLTEKMGTGFRQGATPAKLSDVQRALVPREAILEYVIPYNWLGSPSSLWMFLITRDGFRQAHVSLDEALPHNPVPVSVVSAFQGAPIDISPLHQLIIRTRTAIQVRRDKEAREALRTLYQILIAPLEKQGIRLGDYDRLVIIPHGALHYVPFPALVDFEGKFLIEKTGIAIAPSSSVWLSLGNRSGPVRKFVGLGDPDLKSEGLDELPYAAQEVGDIAKLLAKANPQTFLKEEATRDRLLEEAPSANVLHISTHGDFPDEDALNLHAIRLAKGKAGNGAVRAWAVRTLKLPETRLVSLSVCNGGLYRIGPADEPYGLVPAFLEAGAQNVLGTLWQLDDQFARDFMKEFYAHIVDDGPTGAFREACKRFIKEDEGLRHWAAFVLVGPGRPFIN